MYKLTRWFWRKAQSHAAQDILLMAKKNASYKPVYHDEDKNVRVVFLDQLEQYIIERYIKPSLADDNPVIKIVNNGIQTNPRTTSSERSQSRSNPQV